MKYHLLPSEITQNNNSFKNTMLDIEYQVQAYIFIQPFSEIKVRDKKYHCIVSPFKGIALHKCE